MILPNLKFTPFQEAFDLFSFNPRNMKPENLPFSILLAIQKDEPSALVS